MSGTSFAARWILAGSMAFGVTASAFGQDDAFRNFRQLDSTAKMPKLNAFSAMPDGTAGVAAKDVLFDAKLTADGGVMQEGLTRKLSEPRKPRG